MRSLLIKELASHSGVATIEATEAAARFVMNNYNRTASVTEMLNSLQWHTLEKRRNNFRASLMYKIINYMVDINVHQQFRPSNTTTRGHHQRILQMPTRVDAYMNSFFPFTIKLWNQLEYHIIQAPSLDLFNNYINL